MTFHKEGYTSLALCILFIFVLNAAVQFYFPLAIVFKWIIYIFSFLLFVTIVQFFRSPKLSITQNDKVVLCPADGKVVVIEETVEPEFLKDQRIQVSVFMSPVNVHVNRNPISGVVKYFKYHPAKIWLHGTQNRQQRMNVQPWLQRTKQASRYCSGKLQPALARRIVWYVKEGDKVEQGEQFGFIKFGSRVLRVFAFGVKNVQIGEVVKGGTTAVAELPA